MADAISTSLGGLNGAQQRASQAAQNIARASAPPAPKAPPVDVAKELVDLKQASTDYQANLKAIKAEADNEKRLLDILA